ncbi:serine hydrolase [Rufibacter latericius]|uniref:Serine hydrolase n=2 Tax=Rufibacter latericius TaxID=2487040 RepID=A0A3M9MV19_9BACT|nr:serine hydrolase [Rufibacter latericius]
MPGMSLAVAKNGKVAFERGYGLADVENQVDAGPETVYKVGSLTKQFTAALVMRLVEAGKISLEDPISKYLPEYHTEGKQVTVRYLLNHPSGIKSSRVMAEENQQRFPGDLTYEHTVNFSVAQPFDFAPEQKYENNNLAYYLLGEIICQVTGQPYAQYVEEELLQPLQLQKTCFCDDQNVIQNGAKGYEYEEGKLVNARPLSMQVTGSTEALCSTLGDLIKWTHLLHSGQVVSQASLRQMVTPTVLTGGDTVGYGFGLQVDELDGYSQVSHSWVANGFSSVLAYYPEEGITVAVLTNSSKGKPQEVAKALGRAALGVSVQDLPLPPQELARYRGTYTYQSGQKLHEIRVFREEGKLKAQLAGGKPFRLWYQGNHVFIPDVNDDLRIAFDLKDGRAQGFRMHEGRWEVTPAKRKS